MRRLVPPTWTQMSGWTRVGNSSVRQRLIQVFSAVAWRWHVWHATDAVKHHGLRKANRRQTALVQWSVDHGSHIWKKYVDQLLRLMMADDVTNVNFGFKQFVIAVGICTATYPLW